MESLRLRKFKVVAGTHYGTPKEVWGFRTKSRRGNPVNLARQFLDANQDLLASKTWSISRGLELSSRC